LYCGDAAQPEVTENKTTSQTTDEPTQRAANKAGRSVW